MSDDAYSLVVLPVSTGRGMPWHLTAVTNGAAAEFSVEAACIECGAIT